MKKIVLSTLVALVIVLQLFVTQVSYAASKVEIVEEVLPAVRLYSPEPNSIKVSQSLKIKFIYGGIVKAWTQMGVTATWYDTCVKVNSTSRSHMVALGWGTWNWGKGLRGSSLCKASVLRDQHDWLWSAILGDWHTYISSLLKENEIGDFNWFTVKERN